MSKKALFLGGAYAQMPILHEAKKRGWYVITCDYTPENPGHKLADEYHNISTTDKQKVLELAKKIKPDYVIAYASDPAAPVAAYVSEQLGLPGNSYASVETLSEKDKFRSFLAEHGFNVPQHMSVQDGQVDDNALAKLRFPVIVKPTDSSGSKGVSKVTKLEDIESAVGYALDFSRNKRLIIEEFIETKHRQLHGDAFVSNGELVFCYLGEHHYNTAINPFVPYSTTWPASLNKAEMDKVNAELARAIQLSGFKQGAVNIEVRITNEDKIYIMEIGPRSGGNFVPQVTEYSTGFNMVKAILDSCEGQTINPKVEKNIPSAYFVLHSGKEGVLDTLTLSDELKPYIKEFHQYIQQGQAVKAFQGANAAIGILLLSFPVSEDMHKFLARMDDLVKVNLQETKI